jgi:prepilin-type N-terminal cleavage/methylation domain-containing protein
MDSAKTTGMRRWGIRGFSLVEMLAVVAIILILMGSIIGITGYVRKSVAMSAARAQLAAISSALEMYKSDMGYYPRTGPARLSAAPLFIVESANNNSLYRALNGTCLNCGKAYLRFPASQIQTNQFTKLLNIMDPYGNPYNYYCSPSTSLSNITAYIVRANPFTSGINTTLVAEVLGGQVNVGSYDLISYGLDRSPNTVDDIANWKP